MNSRILWQDFEKLSLMQIKITFSLPVYLNATNCNKTFKFEKTKSLGFLHTEISLANRNNRKIMFYQSSENFIYEKSQKITINLLDIFAVTGPRKVFQGWLDSSSKNCLKTSSGTISIFWCDVIWFKFQIKAKLHNLKKSIRTQKVRMASEFSA